MDMDPKEMEEKKMMVLQMCICKGCPTYVECGEDAGFCFVAFGKSGCIEDEKKCTCGDCPIYEKMGLKHMFYCTRDSEMKQSGM